MIVVVLALAALATISGLFHLPSPTIPEKSPVKTPKAAIPAASSKVTEPPERTSNDRPDIKVSCSLLTDGLSGLREQSQRLFEPPDNSTTPIILWGQKLTSEKQAEVWPREIRPLARRAFHTGSEARTDDDPVEPLGGAQATAVNIFTFDFDALPRREVSIWGECEIRNETTQVIWGREFLEQEGAYFRWSCGVDCEAREHVGALGTGKLRIGDDRSLAFSFLNPRESLKFSFTCTGRAIFCRIDARAPGLVIEEDGVSIDDGRMPLPPIFLDGSYRARERLRPGE